MNASRRWVEYLYSSLSSGALQHLVGWAAVNLGVIPPLVITLGALVWLQQRERRRVGDGLTSGQTRPRSA